MRIIAPTDSRSGASRTCNNMSNKNGGNQQLLLDLFRAYLDARKNKRSTADALAFEANYEERIFALYREITDREYTIGRSICFIVNEPVKREIIAADFRDRIVHHLLFNYLNPIFEKHFIKDSYSCRVGKGTSQGIRRADHFIRSCSENYRKECWILKLDIKGYFMTMDRGILYKKIECALKNVTNADFDVDTALYLVRAVIFNNPTKNFCLKGKREDWVGLPKSKSLFFAEEGKGFPVGNLTSQLFSNIYLDEFDHFVREKLGVECYSRYVDDMVFVHPDKEFLKAAILKAGEYLKKELGLELHPKKMYLQNFNKGVGFLGTYIKPWRIYIGKRTKRNFYAKVKIWNEAAKENHGLGVGEAAKQFIACMNSYLGIMRHYDTYKLRKKIVRSFCWEILKSFAFSKDLGKVELIKRKDKEAPTEKSVRGSRGLLFVAVLLAVLATQAVAPSTAFADYVASGTATSTNLLYGSSAASITNFYYNISSLPGNSSVTVQFSTTTTAWYSSAGVLNGSDTLSTTGGANVSLAALSASGSAFYYKMTINATSDESGTPAVADIRLDYTVASGSTDMFAVDISGNIAVGGAGGVAGSKLSVQGGGAFGSNYFAAVAPTNGLLVEGNAGFGTTSPYSTLSVWGANTTAGSRMFELTNSASTTLMSMDNAGTAYFLGNVGIGTTSPSSLLSVHGNAYTSGTSFFGGALTATSTLNISGAITSTATAANTFPYASTTAFTSSGSAYFAT